MGALPDIGHIPTLVRPVFRLPIDPKENHMDLRDIIDRPLWTLKQLFPLTYRTTYGEGDKRYFSVWRMWLGRCFDVETYQIVGA
jgi:hypothetical protein